MATIIPLFTSHAGITHRLRWEDNGDLWMDSAVSDAGMEAVLDQNAAMATHNDGYSPSREWRRAASIPHFLRNKWLQEEGWDAWNSNYWDKLRKVLNDSDWSKLRTAPGRL